MPSKSLLPDIEIPDKDIWGFLFERESKPFPDDHVIYADASGGRSYTWKQTRDASIEFGKGLKALFEWRKGHVMALFTPNCVDIPAVQCGCLWAGGTCSPANPTYTADEFAYQLKDSGARLIITQKALLPTALKAAKQAGIEEDHIILIGDEKDESYEFKHFTSVKNLAGTNLYRRSKVSPAKDVAFLPYSSGTTGKPKGVLLSHTNLIANTLQTATVEGRYLAWDQDRILGFLPFFHIYGLTILLHMPCYLGYTVFVMPKFDLAEFCRVIQDNKITFAPVVPPVVLGLAKHPIVSKYDLSSCKSLNSGAAPLTRELVETVWNRLKIPVKQGYGLSETSPTTHIQFLEDFQTKVGSVGVMLPNQVAKFINAEEKEVPRGETGELWIKGPNVFLGYLNNPEGTKNAFSEDGYFKTGDVGHEDSEGNFFITDRVKELIKYKGFQIPPAELEGYLVGHDKIDDVAVIGINDVAQATEVPRAYVVLKEGVPQSEQTAKEIISWIDAKVAHHKKMRGGIRFIDSIPKSVAGKILRRVLKEKAKADDDQLKAKL